MSSSSPPRSHSGSFSGKLSTLAFSILQDELVTCISTLLDWCFYLGQLKGQLHQVNTLCEFTGLEEYYGKKFQGFWKPEEAEYNLINCLQ